ncbi:MAG: biotin carboxylase N-terminal domain-containing protein [Pseudohongiellaceae bacterium]
MIQKLLIANRGEIACRIMRTAASMGIECAAVYSDADRNAMHVQMADAAFYLGASAAKSSYLNADRLTEIALQWQADAIHPGYGFLSENAALAARCKQRGIIFVGPESEVIAAMGSKSRAKEIMSAAGIPLLPGYHGDDQGDAALLSQGNSLGYPLVIKAIAGGGGRGLRVVPDSREFADALNAVRREAGSAFGDDKVMLEKYLPLARHIEVQVFADSMGNCVHLFERDCSIQRRHQKLIEEAPAPGINENMREKLGAIAVSAAREIAYTGAGTIEFLYQDDEFYFLEMNTRLQVEHGVTEAICGIDLVEWQLRVAQGEPLPLQQEAITRDGWAMQARINAETPAQDFMPASGLIKQIHWPRQEQLRIDTGFRAGDHVSIYYDSLLAKMIVWAPERELAVDALHCALGNTTIADIGNNIDLLAVVLEDEGFRNGLVHTGLLEQNLKKFQQLAAIREVRRRYEGPVAATSAAVEVRDWGTMANWRNVTQNPFSRRFHWLAQDTPGHNYSPVEQADVRQHKFVRSPLPGRLIALCVTSGDAVVKGQALAVVEAMKMEHTLRAVADSIVQSVNCKVDDVLQPEQVIMELEGEARGARETAGA